jgi:hypothetical protein
MPKRSKQTVRNEIVRTVTEWKHSDDRASEHGETGDDDEAQFNAAMEDCDRLLGRLRELVDEIEGLPH